MRNTVVKLGLQKWSYRAVRVDPDGVVIIVRSDEMAEMSYNDAGPLGLWDTIASLGELGWELVCTSGPDASVFHFKRPADFGPQPDD